MKRLIDVDNGIATYHHDLGDRIVIEKTQNVGAIIENNKRTLNDVSGRMGEWVKIGSVPAVVMERWCREDGINYLAKENERLLWKKLHERDNSAFKTHPGRFV